MADMADTLIRYALLLLAEGDGYQPVRADLRIRDGVIAELDRQAKLTPAPGDKVIDARDRLVLPGFINAHAHSTMALLKGTTDGLNHPAFMWQNQADTVGRSAEEVELTTTLAAADMLRHGITSVIDHVPEQNAVSDTVAPVIRAWRKSGLRAAVALRVFDEAYDDIAAPGLTAAQNALAHLPANEVLSRLIQTIEDWHRPAERISIYVGPSNTERCSDLLLAEGHALAARHKTGFHAHLLETEVQRTLCLEKRGTTPIVRLNRLGALTQRCSFAHCVWVDDAEIALLAESGAVVVHNPQSNAKLGVGTMPLTTMHEAGVQVALGTDGASTNDTQSIHEAMGLAILLPRIAGVGRSRWPDSNVALDMAWVGGAAALG
ncbi:MAG: amidohydrolase family protein, partial [Alphaproteobacteria bacterium]|nr:amidohydrolase family protein [Alphaproteobacteria bacterium]